MSKICKLREIAILKTGPFGTQFKASEYVDEGIPVINVKNIGYGNLYYEDLDFITEETRDRLADHILRTGDIVFGRKGSVDRHCLITEKENGWFQGSDCLRVRITDTSVNPKYVSYYLLSSHVLKSINNAAVGSTMASINMDIIGDIKVVLPPYKEQCRIATTLKKLDDKRAINAAINDNLQQQAALLYDYWFAQFNFPDAKGNPYRSSGGKMVYSAELKQDIPEGWTINKLSDLCTVVLGGTPSTEVAEYWNGEINWLNSGEVAQFPVIDTALKITHLGMKNSPAKIMEIGTTIVSITGNIRTSVLAIETCANQSVVGILESKILRHPFVHQFMLRMLARFSAISTGNCQQHINKGTIEDALILLPQPDILMKYYQLAQPLYDEISKLALENLELTRLRDWLLPMLMNGQATISD